MRVQVAEDGTYRAFTGKMEMGQGSRTLLTQAFAEELGVARRPGPARDGRHAPLSGRRRHVVEPDDAADGARDPAGGGGRARRPRWRQRTRSRGPPTGARSAQSVPNVDESGDRHGREDIPDRRLDAWHAARRHRAKSASSSATLDVVRRRGRRDSYRAFACSATPISSPSSRPIMATARRAASARDGRVDARAAHVARTTGRRCSRRRPSSRWSSRARDTRRSSARRRGRGPRRRREAKVVELLVEPDRARAARAARGRRRMERRRGDDSRRRCRRRSWCARRWRRP